MEQKAEEFIAWYRSARDEFCRDVYIDRSSWIKKKLLPYSNWDSEAVFKAESKFTINVLAKLRESQLDKESISLMALILSSRAEYASDHSDFHVTYIALITVCYSLCLPFIPSVFKPPLFIAAIAAVVVLFQQRITLRKHTATHKELIFFLKQYETNHFDKRA